MHYSKWFSGLALIVAVFVVGACDSMVAQEEATDPAFDVAGKTLLANGYYEGEEIYYILRGVEDGVTERGENDLYLIGGDRLYQPQVVEFVPGEAGYSPHWNVNVVHTADGVTVADIVASPYVSEHWASEGLLFDDLADVLGARDAGLVTIERPGVVVNCPIVEEPEGMGGGVVHLSEDFPPFPDTF